MGKRIIPRTLGITLGDPLGIGAEITTKALNDFSSAADFQIFGDVGALAKIKQEHPQIQTHPTSELGDLQKLNSWQAGAVSVAALEGAMAAFHRGEICGLVTAPISKAHVQEAGFAFPGHTEYLAHATQTKDFVMMMAGPKLRVTLTTIHCPLAAVPSQLTQEKIVQTIRLTYQALKQDFRIENPRVAVCGLNPHAGEQGLLGSEEKEIIAPTIAKANQAGFPCEGPKVPDAVFHEAYQGRWDAVVCQYHDQGLIPFKMIHFDEGVNVTLGLPLVRTSPDHGTAFDIAGQNKADPTSMKAAIELAIDLVRGRQERNKL